MLDPIEEGIPSPIAVSIPEMIPVVKEEIIHRLVPIAQHIESSGSDAYKTVLKFIGLLLLLLLLGLFFIPPIGENQIIPGSNNEPTSNGGNLGGNPIDSVHDISIGSVASLPNTHEVDGVGNNFSNRFMRPLSESMDSTSTPPP